MQKFPKKINIIRPPKGSKSHVSLAIWIILAFIAVSFLIYPFFFEMNIDNVSTSDIIKTIKDKEENASVFYNTSEGYVEVQIEGENTQKATYKDPEKSFVDFMTENGIEISKLHNYDYQEKDFKISLDFILNLGLFLLMAFSVYMVVKSINASGSKMTSFGKSTAKLLLGKKTNVTFKDVAGIEEAQEELKEIVDFLKFPKKYFKLGARIPRGVLLVGAPGSGKTLLARAIAGEADVPFFHTSGAEFEEMLVGAGAARVRDMFKKARRLAPCIIFIDEIDAVAKKREVSLKSSYTEQTLNQILVEMDGFTRYDTVIVLAATNRPDILDPAILRPGRFDRKVIVEKPDKKGRADILKIHTKNKPLDKDVDLEVIAKNTVGLTGAELENIMNEAAIFAVKKGTKTISQDNIEEAILKVMYGPERKSKERTEKDLLKTAYHEAGHAIVSYFTKDSDPVHKISIVSRGMSLGMTMQLPEKDKENLSKGEILARIRVFTAGRIAEDFCLGEISTGAANDIAGATRLATNMVKTLGMSDKVGFIKYGESINEQWLGYAYEKASNYSEKYAALIDAEIQRILTREYREAEKILDKNKVTLKLLAKLLLKKEVVAQEEFENFMKNNKFTNKEEN